MTDAELPAGQAVEIVAERVDALDRLIHVQLGAHRKEMRAALHANEKRLDNIYTSLDRIRDALNTVVPASEFDTSRVDLDKRLGALENTQSRGIGIVTGVSVALGLFVGGFVALALHVFG